jgi:hypothetical protein
LLEEIHIETQHTQTARPSYKNTFIFSK